MKKKTEFANEIRLFKKSGGYLNTAKALKLGIHPRNFYAMAEKGVIDQVTRGIYRLAKTTELSNPDLTTVGLKIPNGVICLISALSFHEITTQIPNEIYVALKVGTRKPKLEFPPVRFTWFSGPSFKSGVETKEVDGIPIQIYSPEKTVVDCFKFRNKIGLDIALEALKLCYQRKHTEVDTFLKYARICRVEKIMSPYLQALL